MYQPRKRDNRLLGNQIDNVIEIRNLLFRTDVKLIISVLF